MHRENPYASPAASHQSMRRRPRPNLAPYRPSLLASWFTWFFRGCDLQLRQSDPERDLVLHDHPSPTIALWILALGGPIFWLVVFSLVVYPNLYWLEQWIGTAVCLLFGSFGLLLRERTLLTSEFVHKTGPFMYRRQIAWADIATVMFRDCCIIWLVSVNETAIRFPACVVGVVNLPDVLERCLPSDVLEECAADLESYRRFVGARKCHPGNSSQLDG